MMRLLPQTTALKRANPVLSWLVNLLVAATNYTLKLAN